MSHIQVQRSLAEPKLLPAKLPLAQTPEFQEYLKLSQKQWVFSDLLHMDKEKTILANNSHKVKVLNLLKHLYTIAAEALEAFYSDRHVHLFDPHVGEASCQIRAIKIALMARNLDLKTCTKKIELAGVFNEIINKITSIVQRYETKDCYRQGNISLYLFYQQYQLDLFLEKGDIFLFCCYALTKFKKNITLDKDVIELNLIKEQWKITKSLANNMIKNLQQLCSLMSVDFLFQKRKDTNKAYSLLSFLLCKDENKRWVLPTYEITDIMFNMIIKYNFPIRLYIHMPNKNDQDVIKYKLIYVNSQYYHEDSIAINSQQQVHKPIIAVDCFVNNDRYQTSCQPLIMRLQQFDFDYLALSSLSTHAQYPGKKLRPYSQEPYMAIKSHYDVPYLAKKTSQLRDYQASALVHGFCHMNPSTLVICHIRCEGQDLL
jgi:hypothetical protein